MINIRDIGRILKEGPGDPCPAEKGAAKGGPWIEADPAAPHGLFYFEPP
jgi:hypothetical protein